ncbi:hypothetical protein, partial [Ureaplasma zalophigenitalium]
MQPRKNSRLTINFNLSNLTNYNYVKKYDFVLHLSSYFCGLAFSLYSGLTSPAYNVLRLKDVNLDYPFYFKEIFSSKSFIQKLKPITFGLRIGKTIKFSDMANIKIWSAKIDEQKTISLFLDKISRTISLLQ